MTIHKRKRCWFCAEEGVRKTFRNRVDMRAHIDMVHADAVAARLPTWDNHGIRGVPDIVHYGARMRRKLGLEYNRDGHLKPMLEAI